MLNRCHLKQNSPLSAQRWDLVFFTSNLRGFQSNFQQRKVHRETHQDKIPSFFQQLCQESFRTWLHLHSWAWERNLPLNMGKICSKFSLYKDLSYYNNCDGSLQLPVSRHFFSQNRAHSTVKNRLSVQPGFCSLLHWLCFPHYLNKLKNSNHHVLLAFRKSFTGQTKTFYGRYSPGLEQTGSLFNQHRWNFIFHGYLLTLNRHKLPSPTTSPSNATHSRTVWQGESSSLLIITPDDL